MILKATCAFHHAINNIRESQTKGANSRRMARENLFVELLGKIRPKGEWELARSRLVSERRRDNGSQGYKKTDGWVKQGLGHAGS